MRQIIFQVPRGQGITVVERAKAQQATNLAVLQAEGADGPKDVVLAYVSNERVDPLLAEVQEIPQLSLTFAPRGVIVLKPPPSEAPQQVLDVGYRSPIEVFLSGLQSVGSWKGFLGYAAASGIVVWIGLFTNTTFLLTAAMLIAPFAGPAMNMALATARGDATLLGRTSLRYFASLAVSVVVAWALSMLLQQSIATEQMVQTSAVSAVAVLLPLVAGAAGALNLVQSERSSLVSGAATGILVAASLAPPAGMIGMAAAIGEWSMAKSGLFLILLQLAGINLSGAIVFRCAGLTSQGVRYGRGRTWISVLAWGGTLVVLTGLITWQFWNGPELLRASRSQRAAAVVRDTINQTRLAQVVETSIRFTRADISGQQTLLVVAYVQPAKDVLVGDRRLGRELRRAIKTALRREGFQVTPLVDITVLEP